MYLSLQALSTSHIPALLPPKWCPCHILCLERTLPSSRLYRSHVQLKPALKLLSLKRS